MHRTRLDGRRDLLSANEEQVADSCCETSQTGGFQGLLWRLQVPQRCLGDGTETEEVKPLFLRQQLLFFSP